MADREDFTQPTITSLARRVNFHCSLCHRSTLGPSSEDGKSLSIGKAAHIIPAAKKGPRCQENLGDYPKIKSITDISNAIWLCGSCHDIVDHDEKKYTVTFLLDLKDQAESRAREELELGPEYFQQLLTSLFQPAPFTTSRRYREFLEFYLGTPDQPVPFGGRSQEIKTLDDWLLEPGQPHNALLTAPAGRGKSALVVRWLTSIQQRDLAKVVFVPVSARFDTASSVTFFAPSPHSFHRSISQPPRSTWAWICA